MPSAIVSLYLPVTLGGAGIWTWATLYRNAPLFGSVVSRLPERDGQIALTFDDGPNPDATPRLLDTLGELGIAATFFLLGRHVRQWPDIARRIANEGHLIANHGFAHQRMDFSGPTRARDDIAEGARAIADATGAHVSYFRAPHGARSPFVTPAAASLGQQTVGWTVGSHDHALTSPNEIAARVTARARAGSIVLMHDGDAYDATGDRRATVHAVRLIASQLRDRGLSFATLPTPHAR